MKERVRDRLAYPFGDFAKAVGVSPNTARNWIKAGLPSYRIGGLLLILPDDFEVWVRTHRSQLEALDPVREEARRRVDEQARRRA